MRCQIVRLRPDRRGFTFIEILFVVVILGVLLAITLPRMAGTRERMALRTAGRGMLSSVAQARELAISHQRDTQLLLDKDAGTWHLFITKEEEEGKRRKRHNRRDDLPSTAEMRHTLPEKVKFSDFKLDGQPIRISRKEETAVEFYPDGTCSGLQIELKSSDGDALTLDIEPASGRAAAYQGGVKTLAGRLRAAGLDPSAYKGLPDDGSGRLEQPASKPGEGFRHIGRTQDETVSAYKDAAARILGTVGRMVDREHAGRENPALEKSN